MPTYEHCCLAPDCKHEWEDMYSIKSDPPTQCPKCLQETAQRLVSGGSGRGNVELTGNDLKEKIKSDSVEFRKDVMKSENLLANVIGESKFNQQQSTYEKQSKEYIYELKSERPRTKYKS